MMGGKKYAGMRYFVLKGNFRHPAELKEPILATVWTISVTIFCATVASAAHQLHVTIIYEIFRLP